MGAVLLSQLRALLAAQASWAGYRCGAVSLQSGRPLPLHRAPVPLWLSGLATRRTVPLLTARFQADAVLSAESWGIKHA